jgi:L-lactate dehydrogenase
MRLADFSRAAGVPYDKFQMDEIFKQTRDAAYHIIERKGATYYAVAAGLMRIVEAILRDQHTILSASSLVTDYYGISDLCLSLPTIVDHGGIAKILHLELDQIEEARLRNSAEVLKKTIDSIGFK